VDVRITFTPAARTELRARPSVHGGAALAEHDEHTVHAATGEALRELAQGQPWAAGPPGAPEAPGGRSPGRRGYYAGV
jgi:hypothetical protein